MKGCLRRKTNKNQQQGEKMVAKHHASKKGSSFKVEVFSPVNGKGEFVRGCSTVEELEGLSLWLNQQDQASKDERQRAYEVESGVNKASPEAKASLVSKACGPFFHAWLRTINGRAAEENEMGRDASEASEEAMAELGQARRILKGMLRALQKEMFGSVMAQTAEMSEAETEALVEGLRADGKALESMAQTLLAKTGAAMEGGLRAYWSSERSRMDLKSQKSAGIDEDTRRLLGVYEPLISYMANKLGPSVMAEFMAKFDAYVASGWAAQDLLEDVGEREGSSVARLKKALGNLAKNPGKVAEGEIEQAVMGRFSELFLVLKVEGEQVGRGSAFRKPEAGKAKFTGNVSPKIDKLAGSGEVDAAIMSVDGKRLVIRSATSDEFMGRQGDQWVRHYHGIKNAIEDGSLKEAQIPKGTVIDAGIFAPAAFAKEKAFGHAILERLCEEQPSGEAVDRFNLAMALAGLVNSNAKPEEWPNFKFNVAGSAVGEQWNQAMRMAAAGPKDEIAERVKDAYCAQIGLLWESLDECGWRERVGVVASSIGEGGVAFVENLTTCGSKAMSFALEPKAAARRAMLAGAEGEKVKGFKRVMDAALAVPEALQEKQRDWFDAMSARVSNLEHLAMADHLAVTKASAKQKAKAKVAGVKKEPAAKKARAKAPKAKK